MPLNICSRRSTARTIWGTHIIDMRNFLRFVMGTLGDGTAFGSSSNASNVKVNSINVATVKHDIEQTIEHSNNPPDWRRAMVHLAMAHAHATRHQLRKEPCPFDQGVSAIDDRNRFLTLAQRKRADASPNAANEVLQIMAEIVAQQSALDTYTTIHLMKLIDRLCVAQTACERIENTSLPLAYSLLVHRTSFFYILLAPWALCSTMGWWTPIFIAIVAYTFFGLDELARQLQEPFRVNEPNALALSAMCRTMERDVCKALGCALPPPLKPGPDSILM